MPERRPNLLILMPDQMRADYLSCYGHPTIATRHIDALAKRGTRLDRAYCAAPLCGPSRISFVTSLRLSEHGRRNYGSCIDAGVPNLVGCLRQAGYRGGMFGKNHCFLYDQLPQVWDELHESCLGNYDQHHDYHRAYDAFTLDPSHPYNITVQLTDRAIDFMDRHQRSHAEKPFLCWVNWQDPHPAFCCPPPYDTMFDPASLSLPGNWLDEPDASKPRRMANWWQASGMKDCSPDLARRAMAHYMGQCRYIDDQVGRLMGHLSETGLERDTLVLFMSDHGELLGDFGLFHKLPTFHECLSRIPVILRYPTAMPNAPKAGHVVTGLVEEVDLVPSLLTALGVETPSSMVGQSWHEDWAQGKREGRSEVLCEAGLQCPTPQAIDATGTFKAPFPPISHGPGAMVGDGRWKLSLYGDDLGELYDLLNDPLEKTNLYNDAAAMEHRVRLTEILTRRLLLVGQRPTGAWHGSAVDLRYNPPEGRLATVSHGGMNFGPGDHHQARLVAAAVNATKPAPQRPAGKPRP